MAVNQIIKHTFISVTIFLCVLNCMDCLAQKQTYSTKSKSAIKNYEEATQYYDIHDNTNAEKYLLNAIDKDSNFIEAHMLLGATYADMDNYEKGIDEFKKAIAINPNFFPANFFSLANFELIIGRYADAKMHFEKLLTYPGAPEALKTKAKRAIINCDFSIEAIKHPVPFDPINVGEGINSPDDEYYPSITVDNKTFVFTRNIGSSTNPRYAQEDFFISENKNGVWSNSYNAGAPLNSKLNEGAPSISADGKLLFFAACDRDDGAGSCDIYLSRWKNGSWSVPKNIGAPVNTQDWETQPSFSSDGKELYFIRGYTTRDGKHVSDIYVAKLGDDGRFQTPFALSNRINTEEAEESVFIHPDCKTLYFSSKGHPGFGGLDIYMSRRDSSGEWGTPLNLGYPINTCNDENSLLVSPDGLTGYFSSDRKGGFGRLDVYSFKLDESLQPQKITYVKGKVYDGDSKKPLDARYEIIDVATGKIVKWANADKTNGEFMACLSAGKDYALNISQPGYMFYSDHFSCKETVDFLHPYQLDIPLDPARTGEKVILKNIFFDIDKFDLKPESFTELEKLVSFLNTNPKLKIEISGHTDNTGDKIKNQTLSENRAKSVYNNLITKNIAATRLTFKGYGDSKPIATNDSVEGRSQNRRTEFFITGVD